MKNLLAASAFFAILLSGCLSQDTGGDFLDLSGKKVVMLIAPGNFRDEELFHTKEVLEGNKAEVVVASVSAGTYTGTRGGEATADISVGEINPADYDAIVFIGGQGASQYFEDEKAISLAKDAYSAGKVVAAICIAPSILANAGLLEGKKATAFSSEEDNLKAKGAEYTGKPVVTEGRIVTANGPAAARDFGKEISRLLAS
jgi:protease I